MILDNALAKKLAVWGFEDGHLIFKDLSLGSVLELTPKDIACVTDEFLNSYHGRIGGFLNSLPPGLSIQFVQVIERGIGSLIERHQSDLDINAPELAKELLMTRTAHLRSKDRDGQIPVQRLLLVLRRNFVKPMGKKRSWKFWKNRDQGDWSRSILMPELKLYSKLVDTVRSSLKTIGIESNTLSESQVFDVLFDQWNPNHPVTPQNFNSEDIRDELLLNDLVISTKGFMLGQVHHRVLSLKVMPEQTFAAMSENLRKMPFGSKLYLTIETLDQTREDMLLQTQRRIAYAMYAGKKGVTDLDSQAKLSDIEAVLKSRVSGETKIFSVALNVVLRSLDESELDSQVEQVLQTFRKLSGAEGMVESLAATSIFLDVALPNARARERSRRMNTEVLSDFLPLFGDWQGHESPRILFKNRHDGLIGFDPFSPKFTNFNQIISGGSGAGKSFCGNLMISQMMKSNPKVFIVDIGGSYKKITDHFDGQYVPIGSNSNLSLNPFDLTERDEDAIDQKIKFMTSLAEIMTKEDGATGIGKLERSEIERMVKDILDHDDKPSLSRLRERLLSSPELSLQRMGKILGPWCGDSPYGKFIDRETNLKLYNRIVCFDLKGLESNKDLQAVCLFLITDLIWREVQADRITPKFVIFDECWALLDSEAGASFLGSVFRTFRKYRAAAIAISQTMDDFANSKVAQAILPNSSVKWLLKQTGGNLPSIERILRLNARELQLVEKLQSLKGHYSDAFLIAGDDHQVVRLESTPLEYWLSTTDSEDLKAMEKLDVASSLEKLKILADRYPRGAKPG